MNILTKTRTILHRTPSANGRVFFAPEEDPQSALVELSEDVWHDMGDPDEVTVIIEPGDKLNDA